MKYTTPQIHIYTHDAIEFYSTKTKPQNKQSLALKCELLRSTVRNKEQSVVYQPTNLNPSYVILMYTCVCVCVPMHSSLSFYVFQIFNIPMHSHSIHSAPPLTPLYLQNRAFGCEIFQIFTLSIYCKFFGVVCVFRKYSSYVRNLCGKSCISLNTPYMHRRVILFGLCSSLYH